MSAVRSPPLPFLRAWLSLICALVVAMVVIGGITRLTGSGLSMVDWNPIMGAIPPLSESDWQATFERYQQFPQYKQVNAGMTLAGFKSIFFWEYVHRLVARGIGVVFVLPLVVLIATGRVDRKLGTRLFIGLLLGGLQGVLGWFMVKSGLVDQPAVSHYRLAAHLLLALIVLAYLLWLLLDLSPAPSGRAPPAVRTGALGILVLVLLQIAYGAFTAGMKAGYGFNTFPLMNGQLLPDGLSALTPAWKNLFENSTAVQFIHRSIAWALLGTTLGFWGFARAQELSPRSRLWTHLLAGLLTFQFGLGVVTLLLVIPTPLAVAHQLGACLVFASAVVLNHSLRGSPHVSA